MSQITDEIAKWPQGGPQHSEARLRDTAEALRALLDSAEFWAMQDRASREASGSMSEQDYKTWRALSYESTSWSTARAILAQLKTEGLV